MFILGVPWGEGGIKRGIIVPLSTYHRYVFPSVLINSLISPLYGRFAATAGRQRVGKPTDAANEYYSTETVDGPVNKINRN